MDGMVAIVLNAVVIVLMSAAIVFGIRLHRRLLALQSAHAELGALLGRLDGALVQASTTVSALKYNAARQVETTITRPAEAPRQTAAVETIKTAPTKVEAAKPAAAAQRRRRPSASLVSGGRAAAADELMAVMKTLRNAG